VKAVQPQQNNAQKPLVPATVYAFTPGEIEVGSDVVTGTIPILGFQAWVLFDSRATHSFMSSMYAKLSRVVEAPLEVGLSVVNPIGKSVVCTRMVRSCPINIGGKVFLANLVVIPVQGFDVILGMDWLAKYYASIDYASKEVIFRPPKGETTTYVGSRVRSIPPILSAI
jgi:hypothetical protein